MASSKSKSHIKRTDAIAVIDAFIQTNDNLAYAAEQECDYDMLMYYDGKAEAYRQMRRFFDTL